ncbi:MAG TPA: hypothetical protein VMH81_16815 [Bryobacteraceae bacterium]|nr:hypothetical protein [Bryobacteraceae bacterium]
MNTLAPAIWRRHSCLPRPGSSGRFLVVHSGAGAFEAAAPRFVGALLARQAGPVLMVAEHLRRVVI